MIVGIDCNSLHTTQAGVARYLSGLLGSLKHEASQQEFEIQKIAWNVDNFSYRQPQRALKTFYRELVWAKIHAPVRLLISKVDLFHSTAGVLVVPPRPCKHISTVHDLAVITQKDRFRRWHRYSAASRLKHLKNVDQIICISQSTANECISLLGLPASKIEVIYNGCDFHPDMPAPEEQKPGRHVPDDFFLFVGSLEPGKNLDLLAEVYRLADREKKVLPPLVIVGARWEGVGQEARPPENWHYFGRIPDEHLVYLYRRAVALVFPSKYEGFGLPVAEAMALGCPVICSKVTSLPEVGGDAAHYAEMNPKDYLEAMIKLSTDADLRAELKERGHRQSLKFSWRKCAREVMDVYRTVMNG